MPAQPVTVDISAEIVEFFDTDVDLTQRARQALVLELLREARISQGKAAELLGISRWAILDLASHAGIPTALATAEDVQAEFETVQRLLTSG